MTEQQQIRVRAALAVARGWVDSPGGWVSPDGPILPEPPDPFTDAADKDALLLWLADDDERWAKFDAQMMILLPSLRAWTRLTGNQQLRKAAMTADKAIICKAAAASLGITMEGERAMILNWIKFEKDGEQLPPEYRLVLVQIAGNDDEGHAPAVTVGYLRIYSSGPFFVTPGVTQHGGVTHYCDCLGDDFHAPLWK